MKRRGLSKQHATIEKEVWEWKISLEKKRCGQRVTKTEIQTFAVEAYKKAGITNFKASDGWYRRWRIRWQQTGQAQCQYSEEFKEGENRTALDSNDKQTSETNISEEKLAFKRKTKPSNKTLAKKTKKEITSHINLDKITSFLYSDQYEGNINDNTKRDCSVISADLTPNDGLGSVKKYLSSSLRSDNTAVVQGEKNIVIGENLSLISELLIEDHNPRANIPVAQTGKPAENVPLVQNQKTKINGALNQVISNSTLGNSLETLLSEANAKEKDKNLNTICRNIDTGKQDCGAILGEILNVSQEEPDSRCQSDWVVSMNTNCSTPSLTFPVTSPLFDQGDFDDHELYCDSCEDFHPRQNIGLCSKLDGCVVNNSLLCSVFEKRRSLSESSNKPSEGNTKMLDSENEPNVNLVNPIVVHSKGRRYLAQFKDQVVYYAIKNSIQAAAEKFKVNRNSVSEWMAEGRRSDESPLKLLVKKCPDSSVTDFINWLEGSKFYVTNEDLQQKALEWLRNLDGVSKPCRWLNLYAKRICLLEDNTIKKRYIPYPAAFKRVVVFYAQTHSNLAASRVFGVSRRRIIEWQQMSKASKEKDGDAQVTSGVTNSDVDNKVFDWYRRQTHPPSSKQVRMKAVGLYRAAGHSDINCGPNWYYRWRARHRLPPARSQLHGDLRLLTWLLTQLDNNQNVSHSAIATQAVALNYSKVSRGWTYRFCKKHRSLLSKLPEPSMPPLPPLQRRVCEYRQTLQSTINASGFTDVNVIAMDEVPLHFLHKETNKKAQLLWQPGFKTCQGSLIVSCLSNGVLLPSMFVFKDVGPSCNPDPRVLPVVSAVGQVTEEVMNQWLQSVCFKQLPQEGGVLVTDCFDAHCTETVKKVCYERSVHHAVIPEGCGFWVLPVISLCLKFKMLLEKKCSEWLSSQSVTGGIKAPSPDQLYHWALRIHKHLDKNQTEIMKTAFNIRLFQPSTPAELL